MTTQEAWTKTVDAIRELEDSGIRVKRMASKQRTDPKTLSQYSGSDRANPKHWIHITFFTTTPEQIKAINDAAKHLSWLGIVFDTSGSSDGERDWELDWSFQYTGKPDGELEAMRDDVEDMLTGGCDNED